MKLTQDKARQFFSLYIPLLWYAYTNYYDDNEQDFHSTSMETKIKVRDILCGNSDIVDAAIMNMPKKFTQEEINIIQKWKVFNNGTFIVLKHLRKHSLFLESSRDPKVYGVIGISDSLSDLIVDTPTVVDAVLLEYHNQIICDGLFILKNVSFGKGARQDIMNSYESAKAKHGIISKSLV